MASFLVTFARCVIMETTVEASTQEEASRVAMDLELRGQLGLEFITGESLISKAHCSIREMVSDDSIWEIEPTDDWDDIDEEEILKNT